jgi:cancer susceptibility candidate protein 1
VISWFPKFAFTLNLHRYSSAELYRHWALAEGKPEVARQLKGYQARIRGLTEKVLDRSTAKILHTADKFQNDKGEIQVHDSRADFKYALWLNHVKNPRFKQIEVPELNIVAELPKSVALATIAARMTHRTYCNFHDRCKNELMSVGGVFSVDLLTLPALPNVVKGWTLRTMTPLAYDVNKVPYPIPAAGADHADSSEVDTDAPPIVISYKLPADLVLVEKEPRVGWWDEEAAEWKTEGVTDVKVEDGTLTYSSVKLTHLALLQSRVAMVTYKRWSMRPSSTGESCIISITPKSTRFGSSPIELEAGDGWCRLAGPDVSELAALREEKTSPWVLLNRLSACGVHLMPEDRDCFFVEINAKEADLEAAFCKDLALLAPAFMMASSKWNKDCSKDDCMVRFAEVTDFDRTLAVDVDKMFGREGDAVRVMLRKMKGCVVVDAKDSLEALTPELKIHMADGNKMVGAAAVRSRRDGFEMPLEPLVYSQTALALLKGTASEDALQRVNSASAPFTENVKNLLVLLRVFTFG